MRARDNPFAAQRVRRIRYRLPDLTWNELLARLAGLRYRAALVGPHGHGKTTLLEELGRRLEARGFAVRTVTLHEGDRRLTPVHERTLLTGLTTSHMLLLDGAEQLGPLAWRRVERRSRAAAGLLVTTHSAGRLPTLCECVSTPELLAGIVSELLGGGEADRLHPSPSDLFARHRGNLRDALRELYDVYAESEAFPSQTPCP
jgi:hypothetical protein